MADTIMCHGESTAGGQSLVSIIWCAGTNFVAIWFMYSARGMQRDNLGQVTHTHIGFHWCYTGVILLALTFTLEPTIFSGHLVATGRGCIWQLCLSVGVIQCLNVEFHTASTVNVKHKCWLIMVPFNRYE